jgi:hypothetical protein
VPFVDRLISVGVLPEPSYVEPIEEEADEFGEQYDEDGNLIGQGEQQYDEDGNPIDSSAGEEIYDEDGNSVSGGTQYDDGARQDEDQGADTLSEMGDGGDAVEQDEESQEENEEDRTPASLTKNRRSSIIRNAASDQVGMKTAKGYSVVWPDLDSNTDLGKAQVAATKVQAMATYVSGNVESVMPLIDFYTKVLGINDEEATQLVKAAEQQQAEMEQEQMEQQMEQQQQFGDQYRGGQDEYQDYSTDDAGGGNQPSASEEGRFSDTNSEDDRGFSGQQSVSNAFCPTGEGGGRDNSCGGRSASEIRSEIKDVRKMMKERGLKETSFMNGGQSLEQLRGNEKLFALRTELEHAVDSKKSSRKSSPEQVKAFLQDLGVDVERLQSSKLMADAATERFNKKYKTSLTSDEFKSLTR